MTLMKDKYQCSAGETFDSVALYVYGDEKYACELMNANPSLCIKTQFSGGEKLNLPEVELPQDDGDDMYAPSTAPWKE